MKKYIILSIAILLSICVESQNNFKIGVYALTGFEYELYGPPYTSYGISIEKQLNKYLGLETGYNINNILFVDNYVKTEYSSIPINLKLYTSVLNISGGVNINFLSDISILSEQHFSVLSLNGIYPNLIGVNISISKDISLSKSLELEPIISLKYDSKEFGPNYGIGLKLKYCL